MASYDAVSDTEALLPEKNEWSQLTRVCWLRAAQIYSFQQNTNEYALGCSRKMRRVLRRCRADELCIIPGFK